MNAFVLHSVCLLDVWCSLKVIHRESRTLEAKPEDAMFYIGIAWIVYRIKASCHLHLELRHFSNGFAQGNIVAVLNEDYEAMDN